MKLAVLFSGGKDSVYAAYMAEKKHEIACLITLIPDNKESYMFHTPNIEFTKLQAESMGIPQIIQRTAGKKEEELSELKLAIKKAIQKQKIEGIVTGAIESVYQSTRIQEICFDLNIWCFNPLWQINQLEFLENLLKDKFKTIIAGVFAYPFDESWLGKEIDKETISKLKDLKEKYKINPSGEGGEIETFVLDCPLFKKSIVVVEHENTYENYSGLYKIKKAELK